MFLRRLAIKGFRRLVDAEVTFIPGLSVIVGENNSGKTSIVDALRAVLGDYAVQSDDFHKTASGRLDSLTLEAEYSGLDLKDEASIIDALVPGKHTGFDARIRSIYQLSKDDQVSSRTELGNSGSEHGWEFRKQVRVVYLQPLRNPDSSDGLRPGRRSQIAALVKRFAREDQQQSLEKLVREVNERLQNEDPIKDARAQLELNLRALSSTQYEQNPDLVFAQPEFERIVATLEATAQAMPIMLNGLGASNLYYIAAVLSDLEADNSGRHRILIIEEPEAHLHPQLQILLLRFLRQAVSWTNNVQVIVTTHSPIFASRAAAESITPIRQTVTGLAAAPINCDPASPVGMRIQQYLNATRSELFFARHLLLVEGDSELLLMNELGRHCGVDVAGAGISVVSVNGLNFALFLPFVAGDALGIPVAILTDGDRKAAATEQDDGDDDGSAYAKNLVSSVEADDFVEVFVASVTFEVELGQSPANREVMLRALSGIVGSRMFANIVGALPAIEDAAWPAEFYNQTFRQRRVSKARFAHELATLISCMDVGGFNVPEYISLALKHVLRDLSIAATASPPQ